MSKLTNLELYKYAQDKYDKYSSPHITKRAFQWMYSEARKEWLRLKFKDFEVTESIRSDLRVFIRDKDFTNTRRINFAAFAPEEVQFVTAVWADFDFECNSVTTTYSFPVKPISIDSAAQIMTDPFNQPNDEFPVYIERNDGQPYFEILSTTVPKVTTVHYVRKPKDYNLVGAPEEYTEEDEAQQFEILDISVKKVELSIENFGKFQGMREEIQTNG